MFLLILIFTISYFFGILFYGMCEAILDFQDNIPLNESDADIEGRGVKNFIIFYKLHSKSVYWTNITMAYFAFTSLSTTGFGDYHPT